MTRDFGIAPSAAEIEAMARTAIARLPDQFRLPLTEVAVMVVDLPEDELLAEIGIAHPYELTGVYEGIPLDMRSIEHSGTIPSRIRLFRLPILDEWADRGDETLEHLVAHITVHEAGHHFGLSDDDMHALEAMVD
ncbi:metallopeptidase family protein [Alteraurantiacibacter aquimixticola]|uniref:Metallopeptidase family protein n=1 Tax=Alteraurantiacibacter aquimixticola TaxID=2489173 RepID=A0A4T3F043_9SPHN|nr:metallopeptidase family protein [Alteraurantiacibacter aquimixticola]TIX49804.1 metallopeptidase family protein [Alteraurantiacibacter aquimixticola]